MRAVWLGAIALVAALCALAAVPVLLARVADRWLWWFEHPDDTEDRP